MDTPIRNSVAVTHHIEAQLYEAFIENASEFLARVQGGSTAPQRAAEIRALDQDAGLNSLVALVEFTNGDTGQCGKVARFLAGLYNGSDFPFDLTELRGLDVDLFEHCIAVLRLDNNPLVEIHRYFPHGEAIFLRMMQNWGLVKRPAPPPPGDFYSAKVITISNAPGYRDATLYLTIGDFAEGSPPTELALSAKDTEWILSEFLDFHRLAWSQRHGRAEPIDVRAGEQRPGWLP